jgi:hypothetical protein
MGMRREVDNFHMFNNSDVKSYVLFCGLITTTTILLITVVTTTTISSV